MKTRLFNRAGGGAAAFTLLEVLLAALVTVLMVVNLYAGFIHGFQVIRITRENRQAVQVLQDKLETARLYSWEQITNGFIPASFTGVLSTGSEEWQGGIPYTGSLSIVDAPTTAAYSNELKLLVFEVNWTSGAHPRQERMCTLVSKYGLHNYIYALK